MRKRECGRRTAGAAFALAAAGGAMILALGGCGQSGPLHLPKESSLAASVAADASPVSVPGVSGRSSGADRDRDRDREAAAERFARG